MSLNFVSLLDKRHRSAFDFQEQTQTGTFWLEGKDKFMVFVPQCIATHSCAQWTVTQQNCQSWFDRSPLVVSGLAMICCNPCSWLNGFSSWLQQNGEGPQRKGLTNVETHTGPLSEVFLGCWFESSGAWIPRETTKRVWRRRSISLQKYWRSIRAE